MGIEDCSAPIDATSAKSIFAVKSQRKRISTIDVGLNEINLIKTRAKLAI